MIDIAGFGYKYTPMSKFMEKEEADRTARINNKFALKIKAEQDFNT
jgi:hypothetical protein